MVRVLTLGAAVLAAAVVVSGGSSAAQQKTFPEVIQLPAGFQPEGIEIKATTFYVGTTEGHNAIVAIAPGTDPVTFDITGDVIVDETDEGDGDGGGGGGGGGG